MSTNDDSASRRVRRAEQGDRRGPIRPERDDRWEQSSSRDRAPSDPYQDPRVRDGQPQRGGGYSNFNRSAYQNPQEPALPQSQGYYPEPVQRNDAGRYNEPSMGYTPPPSSYEREPEPPHLSFHDSGRDDLFMRDSEPSPFGQDPYGAQGGYKSEMYDQNRVQPQLTPPGARRDDSQLKREAAPPPPVEDYDRSFKARNAQEAARFFLPEEEQQQKPRAVQPERAYAPQPAPPQQFAANAYPEQAHYDHEFDDEWADEHAHHEDAGNTQHHALANHANELDEDFFADEDDLESDLAPAPKRSRMRYMIAALAGAMLVGGGGAYLYKSLTGGSSDEAATALIRADNRPLKEPPAVAGGKQFPNGEKTIYDRLTPDGQQVQAEAYSAPAPVAAPAAQSAQPAPGNSLEERIDEALKKAQQANDTPQQPAAPVQAAAVGDQPTVVRSESYRPDGTRVETGRPMVMPNMADANSGQLPPPFGNAQAAAAPAAAPLASPFRTVPVPSSPASQLATATPAPRAVASSGGYWVSLKSAADEKAIQRDLTILTDKYKSVLGDVPLSSKIADLGAKGVHYRAVAGPLNTRQEALELCQKIKGVGGDKACFVTN